MTGIAAGQAAVGFVTGKTPQALAARDYKAWVNDWFRHDTGKLTEFYSRFAGDLMYGQQV